MLCKYDKKHSIEGEKYVTSSLAAYDNSQKSFLKLTYRFVKFLIFTFSCLHCAFAYFKRHFE